MLTVLTQVTKYITLLLYDWNNASTFDSLKPHFHSDAFIFEAWE